MTSPNIIYQMYRNNMFAINSINNGVLKSVHAMPQKDSTSTGDSTFAIDRRNYMDTYQKPLTGLTKDGFDPPSTTSKIWIHGNRFNNGRNNNLYMTPNQVALSKKWVGGNRDASQITANRRVNQTGLGTLNASQTPMSFTTRNHINVVRQAKHRVRSGGATVPAKKIHKYSNAPVYY